MPTFQFAPGAHYESTNLRNLMRTYGVELTEALCFGIAGGIAAGMQFCPSIQAHGSLTSSGLQFIGRVKMYSTNGAFYRDFFDRLGCQVDVRETTGKKAALENLTGPLQQGTPVVAWVTPLGIAPLASWSASGGMYSIVATASDGNTVQYADHHSQRTISLADLTDARDRVCSFKNRTLTLTPPKPPTTKQLKQAVQAGLNETAQDFEKPRLGSFNLPGLDDGIKMITSPKNKRGWPVVFPGGLVFLPMVDCYNSIETSATGGGLLRPLYAAFLREAANILKNKSLTDLAAEYDGLAQQWTAFANWILPDSEKAFKPTKSALRDPSKLMQSKDVRQSVVENFPWSQSQIDDFLAESAQRLRALYTAESGTAQRLAASVRG